jgi:hypothetical protein
VDEETKRYAAILKIKQARLFELDKQAATFGILVPPHIEMERVSLRDELEMLESAIRSPARTAIADELGPAGRFKASRAEQIETKQLIAAVLNKLDGFIDQSEAWREVNRQVLLIIGVTLIIILVAVVAMATYLLTTGHV